MVGSIHAVHGTGTVPDGWTWRGMYAAFPAPRRPGGDSLSLSPVPGWGGPSVAVRQLPTGRRREETPTGGATGGSQPLGVPSAPRGVGGEDREGLTAVTAVAPQHRDVPQMDNPACPRQHALEQHTRGDGAVSPTPAVKGDVLGAIMPSGACEMAPHLPQPRGERHVRLEA